MRTTFIFAPTPDIEVRSVKVEDAPALAALVARNQAHIAAFLPAVTETVHSEEAAIEHLHRCIAAEETPEYWEFHAFYQGELCGALRLNSVDLQNNSIAIGYMIGAEFQGKGIATQAAAAVIGHAFDMLGFNRVELRCATHNQPSKRLAERLGFHYEGELREVEWLNGRFVNHCVYSLLRSERGA